MFGIDKDSLALIQDTAKKSVDYKVELRPLPNDPEKHLLVAGGKHEIIDTPRVAPPRGHIVETIASFAAAFARWKNDGPEGIPDGDRQPNVWLNLSEWLLLFFVDEPLRRSWVKLTLTPAPQWNTISEFRNAKTLDQKALVRLLRHDLVGCVDAGALAAFRSIDFNKVQNAKSQIEHGKQSLDADIVAQVTGERKPEEIVCIVPVLVSRELPEFRARVVLTIDIDASSQRFVLQARPGELDVAMEELKGVIEATLEGSLSAAGCEDVIILAGNPGEAS
jgi:hypothetical protein